MQAGILQSTESKQSKMIPPRGNQLLLEKQMENITIFLTVNRFPNAIYQPSQLTIVLKTLQILLLRRGTISSLHLTRSFSIFTDHYPVAYRQ